MSENVDKPDATISTADKLHCIERELTTRCRRYPKLVAAGRMSQRMMKREIALMEEIAADLRAAFEKDDLLSSSKD